MHHFPHNTGWIEVICGPMFSGKTEELIRRLVRAQIAKLRVEIFKPIIDVRYSKDEIVSHSRLTIPSQLVKSPWEIFDLAQDADVIGIDEAQFLGKELLDVVQKLADQGKRVICAGLDTDYRGEPFEPIPQLLAIAEYIDKTLAICMRCGNPAKHTQRVVASRERVLVGATEAYEPRCRNCFVPPDPAQETSAQEQLPLSSQQG
ncbi:MAG: thymidine kinase [Calditrichaeota bacterium]|nr:thymidine kinase [Calditrichota bacterium]MCB9391361.1 thymidine kinase [Calditrichota bacterium]